MLSISGWNATVHITIASMMETWSFFFLSVFTENIRAIEEVMYKQSVQAWVLRLYWPLSNITKKQQKQELYVWDF